MPPDQFEQQVRQLKALICDIICRADETTPGKWVEIGAPARMAAAICFDLGIERPPVQLVWESSEGLAGEWTAQGKDKRWLIDRVNPDLSPHINSLTWYIVNQSPLPTDPARSFLLQEVVKPAYIQALRSRDDGEYLLHQFDDQIARQLKQTNADLRNELLQVGPRWLRALDLLREADASPPRRGPKPKAATAAAFAAFKTWRLNNGTDNLTGDIKNFLASEVGTPHKKVAWTAIRAEWYDTNSHVSRAPSRNNRVKSDQTKHVKRLPKAKKAARRAQ